MNKPVGKTAFDYRPLYLQVKERLVRRLIDGTWQPGQLIPSEMELARQIGVSQGTVRKALDAMAGEHLLVRQQGRGTYVAMPEDSQVLFRYFRLSPDQGEQTFPQSIVMDRSTDRASAQEQACLRLDGDRRVHRVERVRFMAQSPVIVESISLPEERFSGFDRIVELPNNVYELYSRRWGLTVARASEQLKAIPASKSDAEALQCPPASPLLQILRTAYDLEGKPVEMRVSRCCTASFHYRSELR